MKKGYLYVILFLSAMWIQYGLIMINRWVQWAPSFWNPVNTIFWPLTITLWTIVFTIAFYLSTWGEPSDR